MRSAIAVSLYFRRHFSNRHTHSPTRILCGSRLWSTRGTAEAIFAFGGVNLFAIGRDFRIQLDAPEFLLILIRELNNVFVECSLPASVQLDLDHESVFTRAMV